MVHEIHIEKMKYKIWYHSNLSCILKIKDINHSVAQKLKDIKQSLGESVRGYDKRFRDILSHIPYQMDEKLFIQWFVLVLLHKIREPLRMHEITTYEEAIRKVQ